MRRWAGLFSAGVDVHLVSKQVAGRAAGGGRRGFDCGPGLGSRVVDGVEGCCCLDDRGVDVGGGLHFVAAVVPVVLELSACKFRGGLTGNKTARDSRPGVLRVLLAQGESARARAAALLQSRQIERVLTRYKVLLQLPYRRRSNRRRAGCAARLI